MATFHKFCLILVFGLGFSVTANAAPSGREIYQGVIETTGVYQDPVLQAYINDLGQQIVSVSEMAGQHFTFTLLDAPGVNAFATADNYVYINRGLLAYVSNEAQLVSVLSHEVAHVTQDHVNSMQGQQKGAQFLAMLAAALSGSQEVYEAGMQYANSLVQGHGRDNELEADEVGARYMAKLGYDPEEIIKMLSVMKDMESMQKERAKKQGAPTQTYHGIFSSHPRNDTRLRTAVARAETISTSGSKSNGQAHYREITDGLVWGENFKEKETKPYRYANLQLMVRFDFPKDWTQSPGSSPQSVNGQDPGGVAILTMEPLARTTQRPEEYLYNHLNISALKEGKEIAPARLKGFTGILPGQGGHADQRIAVVYYKMNAYIFRGEVSDLSRFREFDELFLDSIDTFRPISSREIAGKSPRKVHYVKATSRTTFEEIAKHLKLNQTDAEDLRLINGYWPSGEPGPGEWIKIFVQ